MKTASKIAKECGIDVNYIYHIIKKEKIIRKNFLINKYQEDHIHQILYFEGRVNEITIESKINVCTKKD